MFVVSHNLALLHRAYYPTFNNAILERELAKPAHDLITGCQDGGGIPPGKNLALQKVSGMGHSWEWCESWEKAEPKRIL